MNLLSMIEKSGSRDLHTPPLVFSDETQFSKPKDGTVSLTIFYGGQIIVLIDFPVDNAKEIMSLACKSSATCNAAKSTPPNPHRHHRCLSYFWSSGPSSPLCSAVSPPLLCEDEIY
ncbi:hypothetical protein ACS0TY_024066 [Phlomoides rotata]